jgi:chromate transport protein ChrA
VALVGYMRRDLVERRGWFTKDEYTTSLAGACFVLARRAITDIPTLLIALVALGIAWRFKVPEPVLIAAGAAAGLLIVSIRG